MTRYSLCNTEYTANCNLVFTFVQEVVPRLQLYDNHDLTAPKHWRIGMMLSTEPTKQIAFCHVPKASSSTWMKAFGSMNHIKIRAGETDHKIVTSPNISIHATTYYDMKLLNELPQFKFIFVRHPFERLGSFFHMFYYQIFYPNKIQKEWKEHLIKHQQILVDYEIRHMNKLGKDTKNETLFQRFADIVIHQVSTSNTISQTHFWPYTELCRACLVSYDFIGNVETFDDDIQKIADRFPKNQVLQEMRNSKRLNCRSNCGANDFSSKYEGDYKQLKQETIVRLYEIYKNDFEFGGYDYPHTYIDYGIP